MQLISNLSFAKQRTTNIQSWEYVCVCFDDNNNAAVVSLSNKYCCFRSYVIFVRWNLRQIEIIIMRGICDFVIAYNNDTDDFCGFFWIVFVSEIFCSLSRTTYIELNTIHCWLSSLCWYNEILIENNCLTVRLSFV